MFNTQLLFTINFRTIDSLLFSLEILGRGGGRPAVKCAQIIKVLALRQRKDQYDTKLTRY